LKNDSFGLWGVTLESNFGKPLSETTFGGSFSSCPEPITTLGKALGNSFVEQVWGAALHGSFEQQL